MLDVMYYLDGVFVIKGRLQMAGRLASSTLHAHATSGALLGKAAVAQRLGSLDATLYLFSLHREPLHGRFRHCTVCRRRRFPCGCSRRGNPTASRLRPCSGDAVPCGGAQGCRILRRKTQLLQLGDANPAAAQA